MTIFLLALSAFILLLNIDDDFSEALSFIWCLVVLTVVLVMVLQYTVYYNDITKYQETRDLVLVANEARGITQPPDCELVREVKELNQWMLDLKYYNKTAVGTTIPNKIETLEYIPLVGNKPCP